jgi:hypothetical protein
VGRAVDAVDGPLKSNCLSPSSESFRPGVATVDQAPLAEDWLFVGVRVVAVSIDGRLALVTGAGDRLVGVELDGEPEWIVARDEPEYEPRSSRAKS